MKPQDLDPLCSPYTKEIWIGGNVDLDLLSNFPQEYARSWEGWGGMASSSKDSNGGERVGRVRNQGGRRPHLNSSPWIWPLGSFPARPVVPVPRRYNRWSWSNGSIPIDSHRAGTTGNSQPVQPTRKLIWRLGVPRVWQASGGSDPVVQPVLPVTEKRWRYYCPGWRYYRWRHTKHIFN